jgi:uncharacterized protein (TIGR02246 family)
VVATACSAAPAPSAPEFTEADRAAVNALADTYFQGLVDEDWATAASVFAEDAVRMMSSGSVTRGRPALEEMVRAIGARGLDFLGYDLPSVTIEGRGDMAYRWMDFDLHEMVPGRDGPTTTYGKMLSVMERQPDGSWVIVASTFHQRPAPDGS